MTDWILIIILLVTGICLLAIEVIFIPGTTIFGIIGFAVALTGIYISFVKLGNNIGYSVLASSMAILGLCIYLGLKADIWKKYTLKQTISSKVNDEFLTVFEVGEIGTSVSVLRPIGKAEFQNQFVEVQSSGHFIDSGSRIKIIKIDHKKIFVDIAD